MLGWQVRVDTVHAYTLYGTLVDAPMQPSVDIGGEQLLVPQLAVA